MMGRRLSDLISPVTAYLRARVPVLRGGLEDASYAGTAPNGGCVRLSRARPNYAALREVPSPRPAAVRATVNCLWCLAAPMAWTHARTASVSLRHSAQIVQLGCAYRMWRRPPAALRRIPRG